MSKDGQTQAPESLSQQIQKKLSELSDLVSLQEFGPEGPPKNVTFRQIEAAGYRVAQLMAQKFESAMVESHQRHFENEQPCPECGVLCVVGDKVPRKLLTRLGPVELSETSFHCDACRRSFFPST